MTTTSGNMGAMITPPPPPGVVPPPVKPGDPSPLAFEEKEQDVVVLAAHRNNVGGETKISALRCPDGRLFVYEYIEQMNRNGEVSRVVAASALAFGLGDTGKEREVTLRRVATIPGGRDDESRLTEIALNDGRLLLYEQVAQVYEHGVARKTIRNATMTYVGDGPAQAGPERDDAESDEPQVDKPKRGRPPKVTS